MGVLADGEPHAAFVTPTGNITCDIRGQDSPSAVRCDIAERTWVPPTRPADCDLDYGHAFELVGSPTGVARPLCVGDSVGGAAEMGLPAQDSATGWFRPGLGSVVTTSGVRSAALGYGNAVRAGGIVCESEKSGVTCRNVAGRGFTLSRDSYRIF